MCEGVTDRAEVKTLLRQVAMAEPVISAEPVRVASLPQPVWMQVEWDQAVAGLVQRLVRPIVLAEAGPVDTVNA
jgi:hypothetical protein